MAINSSRSSASDSARIGSVERVNLPSGSFEISVGSMPLIVRPPGDRKRWRKGHPPSKLRSATITSQMRWSPIILLVAVGILGYYLNSINGIFKNAQQQLAQTALLIGQEKCAKQAALVFKNRPLDVFPDAWYENHYNEKLNKCVVVISSKDDKDKNLSDAFEGKDLGKFLFMADKVVICRVTFPSGEEKSCNSGADFDQLVKSTCSEPLP